MRNSLLFAPYLLPVYTREGGREGREGLRQIRLTYNHYSLTDHTEV